MKYTKRIMVVTLAALLLCLQIIAVMPQSAYANTATGGGGGTDNSPYGKDSVENQVLSYLYVNAIAKCYKESGTKDGYNYQNEEITSDSHAQDWEFFGGEGTYPGPIIDTDDRNGKTDCGDLDLATAFGLWGIDDPATALCNTGWRRADGPTTQPVNDCIAGSGDFARSDRGDATKKFITYVNTVYYQTGSDQVRTINQLTEAQQYYLYSESFRQGCSASESAENNSLSDSEISSSPNLFRLKEVEGTDIVTTTYKGDSRNQNVTYRTESNSWKRHEHTCAWLVDQANKYVAAWKAYVNDPNRADSTTGSTGTSSSQDIDPCNATGNVLSWVVCPVIDMINAAVKGMEKVIFDRLEVDVTPIFNTKTDTGNAYYTAWNSFRVFAVILIIVAGLAMIISQAMGLDIFDAYTVKKVLPRLLVAAIMISLSWYIMRFFVVLTNDLGLAVRSLIYFPFKGIGDGAITSGTSLLAIITTVGMFAFLQIGGVLSLVATAGLAILIAFLVVVIREIVITMLIITAPIAIACYILPNTEKVYKLWWDSFSKGLMMFPIIAAFIAVGHVFSSVANSMPGTVNKIVGIIAYFLPYFALPFTFRLAGGALATIGGLTNDRSRGAFDRLKKFRGEKAAYNWKRMQNQTRWDNNSWLGKRANKAATWATDPYSNAAYKLQNVPGFRKKGTSIASHIEHQQMEQTRKLAETLNNAAGHNDKAYRALNGALHDGLTPETKKKLAEKKLLGKNISSLSDYDKMSSILASSDDQTERLAANALHGFRGAAATMYQDPEQFRASLAGAGMMGLAQHGFMNPHDLADATNMLASGAKAEYNEDNNLVGVAGGSAADRSFAQALGGQAQLIGARSRPDIKNGYALSWDQRQGKFVNGLAETGADGTVRNDSVRALEELSTMTGDDIGGAKAGIYRGGDKGLGDAMKLVLRAGSDKEMQTQAAEVATWSDDRKRAAKSQPGSDDYKKLKSWVAVSQHESFKQKFAQILGPYSRASIDNTTEARNLLAQVPEADLSQYISNQDEANAYAAGQQQRGDDGGGGPSLSPPDGK